jgi:hypothetical protein
MRNLVVFVALVGAALFLPVFTSEAAAQNPFWVRLDNSSNGGSVPWAATSSSVTVRVYVYNQATPWSTRTRVLNTISGAHDFFFDLPKILVRDVTRVDVVITGTDMFWLDQIEIVNMAGAALWRHGADNMQGWCFSTDPNDADPHANVCEPDMALSNFPFHPSLP